ncbi:hypothetical protein C1H46_034613 [Malus baccata]|uniref:Uncharacterized protein n=1 Tax=Malus baccata TaxID=106549 RepID=A0A540L031_MALBA|nr:hypothetical protein C1H46_034613 [Malus baccata]
MASSPPARPSFLLLRYTASHPLLLQDRGFELRVSLILGAFMVFVANRTPSPLNSHVRIARFFRFSGIYSSSLHVAENGVSVARNNTFTKYIQECVGYQGEQESHNRSQGLMRGKDMSRDQGREGSW